MHVQSQAPLHLLNMAVFVRSVLVGGSRGDICGSARRGSYVEFCDLGGQPQLRRLVMPAIAAKVKAENDAFYWHLGDFRWISQPDEDLLAMLPAGTKLSTPEYQQQAWDDFLSHQIASFGSFPVFLGRGNHETIPPMTREGYVAKFSALLDRPEIAAQRKEDGGAGAPMGPWYHWVHQGVDFITLDNATHDEFSDAQLRWLRGVLDRDLDPKN